MTYNDAKKHNWKEGDKVIFEGKDKGEVIQVIKHGNGDVDLKMKFERLGGSTEYITNGSSDYSLQNIELIKEKEMNEVKISEENIKKAFESGCDDVKKTLKNLFPKILVPKEEWVELKNNSSTGKKEVDIRYEGYYFVLTLTKNGKSRTIAQANGAKIEGMYLWLPFELSMFGKEFTVKINDYNNPVFSVKE